MTKSRIFLWGMVVFVAGVAARSFIFVPYGMMWVGGMAAVITFFIGVSRGRQEVWVGGLFIAALTLGIFRFDMVERVRPDVSPWYGKNVSAEGVVWEAPRRDEAIQRMKIKIQAIDGISLDEPFFILATARPYPAYRMGDTVRLDGVIEKPENFSDFDYISYLARGNIFALIAFPKAEKTGEDKTWRLAVTLSRVKDALEANIEASLPEPHAAFMKGLLLGERASLPDTLVADFKTAGVSHIVALSGYNITLIGRNLMQALLWFTAPFVVSFWIAVTMIMLFVMMTGAAASVVRAAIMGILVLVAQKEGRAHHMTNALAFAGAVMIFQNPYILRFDAGFQLSFLATIGLVYLSPYIERRVIRVRSKLSFSGHKLNLDRKGKNDGEEMVFPLQKILVETLSAQIMVLPLLIFLFGSISLVSPFANIAVLIAVPYAMAAGFIAAMLGFLSSLLGVIAGWGAWLLLEYQLRAISFFAGIPLASVEVNAWMVMPLLALYGVILWKIWKNSQKTRR